MSGASDIRVLIVSEDDAEAGRIAACLGDLRAERSGSLTEGLASLSRGGVDVAFIDRTFPDDDDVIRHAAGAAPETALVAVVADEGEGGAAVNDGADDFVVRRRGNAELLSRAIRYALDRHRLKREIRVLATVDDATGLLSRRGFEPLGEHHLKMADRAEQPVTLIFVKLEGLPEIAAEHGARAAEELIRDTADILDRATRESDVVARLDADEFCVLLAGGAEGAETIVLTRLVEAIAVRNAKVQRPSPLSLSVGSATYDPERPCSLEELIRRADARMLELRKASGG